MFVSKVNLCKDIVVNHCLLYLFIIQVQPKPFYVEHDNNGQQTKEKNNKLQN